MTEPTQNFAKALDRFEEALSWEETPATRDSAILRFEICFETAWKAAQKAARVQGLDVAGPKAAFQAAFQLAWLSDETIWPEIIAQRNNAVHTYNETFAKQLYQELFRFRSAFRELLASLQKAN